MQLSRHSRQVASGIVLLALLLTLVLMSLVLLGVAELWSTARQREKEADLLFIGEQYRRAIERYYHAVPGAGNVLPPSIDDLLNDYRFPVPLHHLRRAYADPMTGDPFELLRNGDRIYGIVSTSTHATQKRSGFAVM